MACSRGCCETQAAHYRSVSFTAAPSSTTLTERRWDRDMPAYKRLRENGLQPRCIDGCGDLEAKADTTFEVAAGRVIRNHTERNLTERMYQEVSA